jgi:hypothetical protein
MAEIAATNTDQSRYFAFLSVASAALSVVLAVVVPASAALASASGAFFWTSINAYHGCRSTGDPRLTVVLPPGGIGLGLAKTHLVRATEFACEFVGRQV